MKRCRLKRYNFQIKNKMSKENKTSYKAQNGNDFIAADVSSRFEFVFFDARNSIKLADETRALVKHKDGYLEMALWISDSKSWVDEGSYCNCGGIGGDITNKVVEFALNGC